MPVSGHEFPKPAIHVKELIPVSRGILAAQSLGSTKPLDRGRGREKSALLSESSVYTRPGAKPVERFIATAPSESSDECPENLGFRSIDRV
ncbi:uncharacterized protein N7459_007142 [Penicillium hispanicum]|uniref:uncharacterized protein n=1 Tax=Penicillium hispanicum TaxID=1080232 RepID=UPI0025402BE4|nr:uncharacterized protein N7459_007142 [Penicillium hispanicum]KAJ5578178.1 hypothetical protein N7459_007142 [Penicillium hispanicum]